MKKKLLLTVLALVCALTCAFGLAACGETPDNSDGDNTQTVAVENVTLNKTALTLEIDGEETLTATVTPDNATNKTVVWASDNTAVATVTNGKVKAVAAGTANITATVSGKSAECTVTVSASVDLSLAGKTFVFSDIACDAFDAETLAEYREYNSGLIIVFDNNNGFTMTQTEHDMVQSGTYTNNSGTIVLTITGWTFEGEPVDNDAIAVNCTYDGEKYVMASSYEENTIYSTFLLQAE